MTPAEQQNITLHITRIIKAKREQVFEAWTDPSIIMKWWGPGTTSCPDASVDLSVGGLIRIANKIKDGTILWIEGQFEEIEKPSRLVYSWRMGDSGAHKSLVTVNFNTHPDGCELELTHERFATESVRDSNLQGWDGCLDGLEALFSD